MLNETTPFFILGNPRSGTTILRLMLDSHPNITVPPECGFMVWFYNEYSHFQFDSREDISKFISKLKKAKKIDSWNLDYKSLEDVLLNNLPLEYKDLINLIYRSFSLEKDLKIWGDKNNYYINHIQQITSIYPRAKFIHIVRDGRDVACSYKELNAKNIISEFAPKLPSNISQIAMEWCTNNLQIEKGIENYAEKKYYHLIRYEDLINNSEFELQKITEFLELDYSSEMLKYHYISKSYEPEEYFQWKAKTKTPPNSSSIGRYRNDLSPSELDTFLSLGMPLLMKYGYEF